jgi:predicted hydrocarbon binding protein
MLKKELLWYRILKPFDPAIAHLLKNRGRGIAERSIGNLVDYNYCREITLATLNVSPGMTSVFKMAGEELGRKYIEISRKEGVFNSDPLDLFKFDNLDELRKSPFFLELKKIYSSMKIGSLEIFKYDKTKKEILLRIKESALCYDVPNVGKPVCYFEVGRIGGMIKEISKKTFLVYETRCRGLGDDFCEFLVRLLPEEAKQ